MPRMTGDLRTPAAGAVPDRGTRYPQLCDSRFGNFTANETQGGKVGAQTVAAVATKILPPASRQARRR